MNREEYLQIAAQVMRERLFQVNGFILPEVKISVGFPGGGSARTRAGEFWKPQASNDNVGQIFISPTIEKPAEALAVLAHELCHAVAPEAGHKGLFRRVALAIGLTGPMKSTVPGAELSKKLTALVDWMIKEKGSDYPHAAINLEEQRKQTTRMKKATCARTGYTVRLTKVWIQKYGNPICPCCNASMI